MKKKTPNAEHRTSNIEFRTICVHELPNGRAYGPTKRRYDLEERLLEFAVQIISITDQLPNTRAANHIAGQLLRSGTAPFGNHGEVESAESRKDFVHKLKVCLKELRETRRWLRLIGRLQVGSQTPRLSACIDEADELIRIFVASVRTAEKNS